MSQFAYDLHPLVEQNKFRKATAVHSPSPRFDAIRDQLPAPVLPQFPEWEQLYWRSWREFWAAGCVPSADNPHISPYIDSGYNENMFMWDTAFMIQTVVYGRRANNFANALDNFYAKQHPNGFICREINMETGQDYFTPFDPNATGPNILAWAEWRLFRHTHNIERLGKIFWPLVAYHRWCQSNRTWQDGLYWATGMSSAMDNQPRVPDSNAHHRHWTWVDASLQAAVSATILEQMALLLKQKELASDFSREKNHLITQINGQLWSEQAEFYLDRGPNGRFSDVKTIGAFWALQEKSIIPEARRYPFVQHLRDSWSFGVMHPIPTQSSDSEGYNGVTGNYWRGAVWPATTFMVLKGLRQLRQHKLVHEIAKKHLDCVTAVFEESNTLWENYAPESNAPGQPAKEHFWSMSAITPIAMLLEDVIGIHVDWPQSRLYWDKRLESEAPYGVRNYPLGEKGTVDLTCEGDRIFITTDTPFTLVVRDATLNLQTAVSPGTTEIELE